MARETVPTELHHCQGGWKRKSTRGLINMLLSSLSRTFEFCSATSERRCRPRCMRGRANTITFRVMHDGICEYVYDNFQSVFSDLDLLDLALNIYTTVNNTCVIIFAIKCYYLKYFDRIFVFFSFLLRLISVYFGGACDLKRTCQADC